VRFREALVKTEFQCRSRLQPTHGGSKAKVGWQSGTGTTSATSGTEPSRQPRFTSTGWSAHRSTSFRVSMSACTAVTSRCEL
jgi:hypothetical protein